MTRPFPTQGLLTTSIVLAAALPALAQGKPNCTGLPDAAHLKQWYRPW